MISFVYVRFYVSQITLRLLAMRKPNKPIMSNKPNNTKSVLLNRVDNQNGSIDVYTQPVISKVSSGTGDRTVGIITEKELRIVANIPDTYRTISFKPNSWIQQDKIGPFTAYAVKGTFSPPSVEEEDVKKLINDLAKASPKTPKITRLKKSRQDAPVLLEISIPDLHLGSIIEPGIWTVDKAKEAFLWAVTELTSMASNYHIEKIVMPIGNDFMHCDNRAGTTTKGTTLSDAGDYRYSFREGIDLLTTSIDQLKQIAPVLVLCIPGNHDFETSVSMAHVIEAYYRYDKNVEVNAGSESYKFLEYGNTLLGFEHGHSGSGVKLTALPALMANEMPEAWARTKFREWHLGDQHRQGSVAFADQGVVIEYLPSLTASNDWSNRKGFNHHRRAAMAFVYDKVRGPVCRLQVNL